MRTKIQINDQGEPFVVLPPFLLDAANLTVGDEVILDVEMVYGTVVIHPIDERSHEDVQVGS